MSEEATNEHEVISLRIEYRDARRLEELLSGQDRMGPHYVESIKRILAAKEVGIREAFLREYERPIPQTRKEIEKELTVVRSNIGREAHNMFGQTGDLEKREKQLAEALAKLT